MSAESVTEIQPGSEKPQRAWNITINTRQVAVGFLALLFVAVLIVGIRAIVFLQHAEKVNPAEEQASDTVEQSQTEDISDFRNITVNYKAFNNKNVEITGYVSGILDGEGNARISLVENKSEVLGFRESQVEDEGTLKEKLSSETARLIDKSAIAVYGLNTDSLKPGDRITISGTLTVKSGRLEIRDAILK